MFQRVLTGIGIVLFLVALQPTHAIADEALRDTGKRLANDFGDAVINVRIVASHRMSYGGQTNPEEEQRTESSGTIVSPEGLTIVPLTAVDPAQMIQQFMGSRMGDEMKMESQVKDLRLIVGERKEIPAEVILRDPDLGIALLRPIDKPDDELPAVDLAQDPAEPELLDSLIALGRLGKVADDQLGVMTGEVQAIVRKPRKFYITSGEITSGGMGSPVFTADGKLLGLVMVRTLPGGPDSDSSGMMEFNSSRSGYMPMVMPLDQIRSFVEQAPARKEE